ncbi:MAG: DnaJ domain-containing protein [Candidatus Hodarchaeota archaeon]
MRSKSYDVVVIGCGPGGAVAGRTAALNGAKTLIVAPANLVKSEDQWPRYLKEFKLWGKEDKLRKLMNMSLEEAYRLLGVKYPTTLKEVKVNFLRLAKKHHPDVNDDEDATKVFQEIYEAYEVILEEEFRNDLTWFYEWRRKGQITADIDPFELHYDHIWMPKIAKMLENLKEQKEKNQPK